MKNKYKFLTSLATLTFATPMIATVTACSKKTDYQNITTTIYNTAIDEFYDLSKVHRPTFRTRKICDYLKAKITDMGLGESLKEDNYRSEQYPEESSGNLTYEIPATHGMENIPKIILQGHMDMVCSVKKDASGKPIEYDWSKGVEPIQEGDLIHSKDYLTTLGADDGIGVATLLSLTKHRDSFAHGPIRVIITADEEDSPVGISSLSAEWVDAPFALNLDWEYSNELVGSCAGANENKFEHWFAQQKTSEITDSIKYFTIEISGLKGGHSGLAIGENRANAIVLMANLLEYIMHAPGGSNDIYISSIVSANSYTAIPDAVTFTFGIKMDSSTTEDPEAKMKDWCEKYEIYTKFGYPIETDLKIASTLLDGTEGKTIPEFSLTKIASNQVLEYITMLPFGPISYDIKTGFLETCGNIGGITGANKEHLSDSYFCLEHNLNVPTEEGYTQNDTMHLTFGLQGRSSNPLHLGPSHAREPLADYGFYSYYINATWHVFESEAKEFKEDKYLKQIGWLPPWQYKENDLLTTLSKASIENKSPLVLKHAVGWVEPGQLIDLKPSIRMASIGAQIDNPHKNTETLHLSTARNMIFNTIYLLCNMPSAPIEGEK